MPCFAIMLSVEVDATRHEVLNTVCICQKGSTVMLRKLAVGVVAATLATTSIAAQAAPSARVASPVVEEEGLAGGFLLPVLLALAGGLLLVLVLDGDDEPVSP